ncbi:N-acetylneuraminate synthase [Synechococcales cyanobacterium C]|uniref:N-acetylneuraminate synthase n=1 Tax=Petrachloros mirabilis ULC683 TaxID=2781853 RepID=A0A8K2A8L5_9CYAN|nr:N-acetylneuraminate synthase [Petrachloros mirabilis]NCJ07070.1 N-acetylneuraminate synthase [Petrachloros mirabilis ULC683]
MRTLVIAEAGVNHNGDMAIAKALIDVAADAGVDLVKFQTFKADRLVTTQAKKAEYQNRMTAADESQHAMIRRLELTREMHDVLIAYCQERGIGFFSTGFDPESVDLLVELGLDRFKIPSGEITNLPYLRHVGRYGKLIILSTGMATLGEIEAALEILEQAGTARDQITVLHCNTEYPTPIKDVNLRAMVTIREALGVTVGYSDHTLGIEVSIAAVALGATVIEKHFTLDRNLPGPDHRASLEPEELKAMVRAIRNIEEALGDGRKRPSQSEVKNKPVARKSIVAACAIKAGEALTPSNIVIKRPGTGISPMRWDEIVGRKVTRGFETDELIEL